MSAMSTPPDPAQNAGVPTFGALEDLRQETESFGANPHQDPSYQGIGIKSAPAQSRGTKRKDSTLIGSTPQDFG